MAWLYPSFHRCTLFDADTVDSPQRSCRALRALCLPALRHSFFFSPFLTSSSWLIFDARSHCRPTKLVLELLEPLVEVTVASQSGQCFRSLLFAVAVDNDCTFRRRVGRDGHAAVCRGCTATFLAYDDTVYQRNETRRSTIPFT